MEPFTMAALAISAGSAVSGFLGSKEADKNAKDKAKHDTELMRAATEAQVDSILAAKDETQNTTVQKMSDIAREAALQRGRIIAAAGEAGIAGASPSKQLLASFYKEADSRGRELYNLAAYKRQANRDIRSAEAGLQVNLPTVQKMSPSIGASLFAGALDALTIYQSTKPR